MTRGSCFGGLLGAAPLELHAGDVIVFPRGDAHVMSSAPGRRAKGEEDPTAMPPGAPPFLLRIGGPGPRGGELRDAHAETASRAEVVCGFLGCDARPFNPLLAALPRVVHVRARDEPPDGLLPSLIALAWRAQQTAEAPANRPPTAPESVAITP